MKKMLFQLGFGICIIGHVYIATHYDGTWKLFILGCLMPVGWINCLDAWIKETVRGEK